MTKSPVVIYGDDARASRLAAELRRDDQSLEISLVSPRRFNPDVLPNVGTVYLLGSYPEIAAAFDGKAEVIEDHAAAEPVTPKPVKKGK